MSKYTSLLVAAAFAAAAASPVAMAQVQKREQVDKGTAAQGTGDQKKAADKRAVQDKKKDGSGEGKKGQK